MNSKQLSDFLDKRLEKISEELLLIKKETGIERITINSNGHMDITGENYSVYNESAKKYSFMFHYGHNIKYKLDYKRCSYNCNHCHCGFCKEKYGENCK